MWIVLKIDKKKLSLLKQDIKNFTNEDIKMYAPKILLRRRFKKKIVKKEFDLIGDYFFFYNKKFKESSTLSKLRHCRGLKNILNGFILAQREIENFIKKCKLNENQDGYQKNYLIEEKIDSFYKFSSGPFSNEIFKILEMQKNKLKILLGKIKINVNKNSYLYLPE